MSLYLGAYFSDVTRSKISKLSTLLQACTQKSINQSNYAKNHAESIILLKTRPAHANVHFHEISLKTSYHNRVATESLTLISFPKGGDILNHLRKTKKAAASDGGAEQLSKQILHNKPSFLLDRMNTVKMHKWKNAFTIGQLYWTKDSSFAEISFLNSRKTNENLRYFERCVIKNFTNSFDLSIVYNEGTGGFDRFQIQGPQRPKAILNLFANRM